MHLMPSARRASALLCTILLFAGCTTLNHPPERIWPAETPGSYAGRTSATQNGEWWFPSEIGPMQVPPQGGNKGTVFYLTGGSAPPTPAPPTPQVVIEQPVVAPPPPGVVRRVVYNRVFVDKDVRAERLIFPAITFAHGDATVDAEAQNQLRQAAAAIQRARGYDVLIEGRREANERSGIGIERAAAVHTALLDAGVASGRLSVMALGAVEPLSHEDSAIAHELNRCTSLAMVPAGLELNPTGPEDEPMPDVPAGKRLETVTRTVTVTVPRLVYIDRLVFPNILFDYDKADLRPESVVRADRAAAAVGALVNVQRLTVVGHCDHFVTHEYNDGLSKRRANTVRDRLIESGLSSGTVSVDGKGKRQPIADNDTAEGRQLNRRVEFHIEYGN